MSSFGNHKFQTRPHTIVPRPLSHDKGGGAREDTTSQSTLQKYKYIVLVTMSGLLVASVYLLWIFVS
jgi:hypothetical protein